MFKPIIYLDQDGVLADFEGWAARMFGEFPLWKQEIEKPEWGKFSDFHDMFLRLDPMPDALELYNGCVEITGDKNLVQVLTALPNRASHKLHNAAQHKIEWCHEHISPDLRVHFGPFAQHKQYHNKHPHDVLIDDMKINIDQWNDVGGFGILHTSAAESLADLAYFYDKIRNDQ